MLGDRLPPPGRAPKQTARKTTLAATPARRQLAASTSGNASAREVVDLCDSSDSSDDELEPIVRPCRPSPAKRARLVYDLDADEPSAPSRARPWVQRLVPSANNANRVTLGRGVNGGPRVAKVTPLQRADDNDALKLPPPIMSRFGTVLVPTIRRATVSSPRNPLTAAERDEARGKARELVDQLVKRRGKEELGGSLRSMRSDRRVGLDVSEILVENRYRPLDLCSVFVDGPLPESVEPQGVFTQQTRTNLFSESRSFDRQTTLSSPGGSSCSPSPSARSPSSASRRIERTWASTEFGSACAASGATGRTSCGRRCRCWRTVICSRGRTLSRCRTAIASSGMRGSCARTARRRRPCEQRRARQSGCCRSSSSPSTGWIERRSGGVGRDHARIRPVRSNGCLVRQIRRSVRRCRMSCR